MAEYRDNRIDRRKSEEKKQQGNKWDDVIIGRNAVTEALRVGRSIDSILMARGNRTGSLQVIAAKAREKGIPVKETDVRKLDHMCGGENHQGVAALAAVKEYAQLDDLFRAAEEKGEAPFFILCDELEDPHNLGAILRTAECAGAPWCDCAGTAQRRSFVCGGKGIGRCCGVCTRVPGAQYGSVYRRTEKTRCVDLCSRYGRGTLVPGGLYRGCWPGDRQRRFWREPPCERKIGFYHIAAHAGQNKLTQCVGGLRGGVL